MLVFDKKIEEEIYSILLKRSKDVDKYFSIQKMFNEGLLDIEFEKKFRQFYRMNTAGLTQDHFKVYFKHLKNKESDLVKILTDLYNIKTLRGSHSLQFSFTTKLLHTIDNNLPIFDKFISSYFSIANPNDFGLSLDKRLEKRQEMYCELVSSYKKLLLDKQVCKTIQDCRSRLSWPGDMISDIKVLDFMLWANGQIK